MSEVKYETMTDGEVAQTVSLEIIEQEINNTVLEIKKMGVGIPKANDTNPYTRACWFLGETQRVLKKARFDEMFAMYVPPVLSEIQRANAKGNLRFLKAALPRLREKYQR